MVVPMLHQQLIIFTKLSNISATTHSDLLFRAKTLKIQTYVIHNASMINAVSSCGLQVRFCSKKKYITLFNLHFIFLDLSLQHLQVYLFGEVVSIPFFTENWIPESVYEKIYKNTLSGLHTLCLLGNEIMHVNRLLHVAFRY
jgi:diphthine methyl ester synthase